MSEMSEKDLLQKLKDDAENVTPPDSLSPDAMEELLRAKQLRDEKSSPGSSEIPGTGKSRGRFSRFALRAGSLAAVFVLAFGVIGLAGRISENRDSTKEDAGQAESGGIVTVLLDDDGSGAADSGAGNEDPDSAAVAGGTEENPENATVTDTTEESPESAAVTDITENHPDSAVSADDAAADPFTYASSYEEIYDALYEVYAYSSKARLLGGTMMISDSLEDAGEGAAEDGDSSVSASSEANLSLGSVAAYSTASGDAEVSYEEEDSDVSDVSEYSATNVQEYGVDEGDVLKTDGSYIYILRSDGEFLIVSVGGDAALISRTSLESENDLTVEELYLDGDTLNVITREYMTSLAENEDGTYYTRSSSMTVLYTFDVSDRSEPVLSGTVTQEGYYSDSRKVGSHIYLFSTWQPSVADTLGDSTISPLLNGKEADAGSYYLPDTLTSTECLIISSVDITAPSEFVDHKILVSGADDFYVSQENIYIVNKNYENSNTVSEITKFHYEDGVISGVAAGSVTGWLNDSFSMSEYGGNLRVVTTYYGDDISPTAEVTDWTEHNALYILSESMKQLSVLSDLAAGETVRSARFLGDTGYFVTFQQTDPLFSVDLSDPENPEILGELKISGFSSYLHFYGDGLLLGIGYEADESTGSTTGLKLSMFDISDPSNVTEAAKYVIDGVTWCPSLDNYKSILADAQKNLIGFYCEDRYLLFSYNEEEGFVQEMIYDFYADQLSGAADSSSMRGLYISDTFYLAGSTFVISFDMNDSFEKTQVLTID